MKVDDVLAIVGSKGIIHVVVTGGEPLLFEPIVKLCLGLELGGHVVTIETAGTVYRKVGCDLLSISPKLANSLPHDPSWVERHETTRRNLSAFTRLMGDHQGRVQLKFVVNPEADLEGQLGEILALLGELPRLDPAHVCLMAEGIDEETLWRRERMLVPVCTRMGFRLTPRYHVMLFGNSRGT